MSGTNPTNTNPIMMEVRRTISPYELTSVDNPRAVIILSYEELTTTNGRVVSKLRYVLVKSLAFLMDRSSNQKKALQTWRIGGRFRLCLSLGSR